MGVPQNTYPNFTNFPFPSFPQEVVPPDSDPDAGDMICVTYSRSWTAVLMSACSQLTQLSSWKGTDSEKTLAVQRATNLQAQLQHDIGCDMDCCYDTVERRITSDGKMQISINGGDWQQDPSDPRVSAPLYPPPVFDDHHTKCDAATNVAEHLNDVITETSDQLGGAGSLIEIAAAIAAVIFALFLAPESIPALVPLILPLISAVLFLGQAAFDAYFDSTVHDKILCAIYCTIGDDGTFTDDQYAALISKLTADLPASPAKDYFIQIVGRIGLVGMNDYAAVGTSADADCSECACDPFCDGDWITHTIDATEGAILGQTSTTITLETGAPDTDGKTYVCIVKASGCCEFTHIHRVSGSGQVNIFWAGCGDGISHVFDNVNSNVPMPDQDLTICTDAIVIQVDNGSDSTFVFTVSGDCP